MRTFSNLPATRGDVIECRGTGNAPGAGGIISTVIVTDKKANGYVQAGGYECRDATPSEVEEARTNGQFKIVYSS